MLKGLEVSEIQFSNLSSILRIDAEFFKKPYLLLQEKIRKYKSLDSYLEYLTDGTHVTPKYMNKGIPFLSSGNIGQLLINFEETKFIGEEEHANLKHCQPSGLDLLVSKSGRIGHAAVVPEKYIKGSFNIYEGIALLRLKDVHPYTASVIFNSNLVQLQIKRMQKGVAQPHLHLEDCREILLPRFSEYFELSVRNLAVVVSEYNDMARNRYIEAEHLLLKAIGLEDFSTSSEKINIKSFKDSFVATGRLDAEYYQCKYEELIEVVKNHKEGANVLENFVDSYSTGFPFQSETYAKDGVYLIRINNVQRGNLDLSDAIKVPFTDAATLSPKNIAKENDILISMSGTIGNSCKIPKGVEAVINQRIFRFTPKNYDPEVLSLIINSIIGLHQLNRIGTGGVQTNISSSDILKIQIPLLSLTAQSQISSLIQESFTLKTESERLLNVAKQAVEMAIEQDEESATKWIQEQLKVDQ